MAKATSDEWKSYKTRRVGQPHRLYQLVDAAGGDTADPTLAEVVAFVRRQAARRDLSDMATQAMIDVLAHPKLCHRKPSLRAAARMLQRAEDLEHGPIRH